MQKDLLSIQELTYEDVMKIISSAALLKKNRYNYNNNKPLNNKSIGLIFSKSSTRTRVSFEVGIRELGGFSIYLDHSTTQLGRGETFADTARVLSRYLHAVIIRTYEHKDIVEFAKHANISVINALTNEFHPCQVLADLFTIYECYEKLDNIKIVFLGDGQSNMANSWILGAKLMNMNLVIASPEKYKPSRELIENAIGGGNVSWTSDPKAAVEAADIIYTDVWVSMGFESEARERLKLLQPFQVNTKLLENNPNAFIMHCLPAHRGEEITDEVLDSHKSIVFDQAENRLHVQKAILTELIGERLP